MLAHLKKGRTIGLVQDRSAEPPWACEFPFWGTRRHDERSGHAGSAHGNPGSFRRQLPREGGALPRDHSSADRVEGSDPDTAIAENTAHYAEILSERHLRAPRAMALGPSAVQRRSFPDPSRRVGGGEGAAVTCSG